MSTKYTTQQFEPPQGLQPAIPFERPAQQTRTPLRQRETPIHPPQVPPAHPLQPKTAQQQPEQPSQTPQAQKARKAPQTPQQAALAEQLAQAEQAYYDTYHGGKRPTPAPANNQDRLDEEFLRAEQAYLAAYRGVPRPQPVYHTIDPNRTTLDEYSPYVVYRPLPDAAPGPPPPGAQQSRRRDDVRFISVPAPAVTPRRVSEQAREQATGQVSEQISEPVDEQVDEQVDEVEDETMQDDGPGSGDNAEDAPDGAQEGDGSPDVDPAPLVQPITPLQYPAVRPTLKLGPYDTREEATKTLVEYGIAQGYMLVQSGCARSKTNWGGHETQRPIVRVDFMCDRSGTCKNSGTGKRKRPTHKLGCPTRLKVVCRKRDGCKWFIDPRVELHNHDLNLGNMESIASYRRWRRIQGGGASAETRKERTERKKRAARGEIAPAPVPPPMFHNAGPQPPSEPTGPVHMAALKGQVKILEILLNKGGDIDAYDSTGRTALHCAIEGSRMDAFKMLIERGANVTRCDAKGLSPLRMAVERGMEDAVLVLIEMGADPNK